MDNPLTYVALLRGINVGGHHKVPMADLRKTMTDMGLENVVTLLNSGNVIFDARREREAASEKASDKESNPETTSVRDKNLESEIELILEKAFGFPIPVLIRTSEEILEIIQSDPFKGINVTKKTRLYISFLKENPDTQIDLPWTSEDGSYTIIDRRDGAICSVLDLSVTHTPKGMDALEKLFGKNITTRNWNTLNRIAGKL